MEKRVFAKRLRELREYKKMSYPQLSKATGINISSLWRWENENAYIYDYQLIKLAKFFGVTSDYLIGLED